MPCSSMMPLVCGALRKIDRGAGDLTDDGRRNVDIGPLRDSLGFLLRMAQLQTFEQYFTEGSSS